MRIEQLNIQAFRSFGSACEPIDFGSPVAVVWGPNSGGKTSLAEAFEFLLTGDIARRELLASAKDEFAGALRNVHAEDGTETFVEATLLDGETRLVLRRTLTQDFGKKQACTSRLELDGKTIEQSALEGIGIELAEPPMAAPVLMQHTLGYLFSAQPKQRAAYFKALLEVGDLDEVRDALVALQGGQAASASAALSELERFEALPSFSSEMAEASTGTPGKAKVSSVFSRKARELLESADLPVPEGVAARAQEVARAATALSARTFPLAGFQRGIDDLGEWKDVADDAWPRLDTFVEALGEVDAETQRLVQVYEAVLELPQVDGAAGAVDCPVCETSGALTTEQVERLKEAVAATAGLKASRTTAVEALGKLRGSVESAQSRVKRACPAFLGWSPIARAEKGFRTGKLVELSGGAAESVDEWFKKTRLLVRARRDAMRSASTCTSRIDAMMGGEPTEQSVEELKAEVELFKRSHTLVQAALTEYLSAYEVIEGPLREGVEEQSAVAGWGAFASRALDLDGTVSVLVERAAVRQLEDELEFACRHVEKAKQRVLDDKFRDLQEDVRVWWELLRPGEPSFFSSMGLRQRAQRTIDFKAGLAASEERQDPQIRDAVAVFSQSQLVCLGLATFLARAAADAGFVVLDDPVTTMDDDYSFHFINGVLAELQERGVQAIVLTYEQRTWKNIQQRYQDGECEAFELTLDVPKDGTVVVKSSDSLSAMLESAKPFTRSSKLATRKDACKRLRDASERLCKEILVRKRRDEGDDTAMLDDYSQAKWVLNTLIDECVPYLSKDKDDGKLRFLKCLMNPGSHDGDVPSKVTLANCLGQLRELRKRHLR